MYKIRSKMFFVSQTTKMADLPYQPLAFARHIKMSKDEAITFLRSEETPTNPSMPFKPKGGEVYCIKVTEETQLNIWRATGNRFYQVISVIFMGNSTYQNEYLCLGK